MITSFRFCFHFSMYSGRMVCQLFRMSSVLMPSKRQRTCIKFSYLQCTLPVEIETRDDVRCECAFQAVAHCIVQILQACSPSHGAASYPVSMTGLTSSMSLMTCAFWAFADSDLNTSGQCCSAACITGANIARTVKMPNCSKSEAWVKLLTFQAVRLLSPTELQTTPSKSRAHTAF